MELPKIEDDFMTGSRYFRWTLDAETPVPEGGGVFDTARSVGLSYYVSPGLLEDEEALAAILPVIECGVREFGAKLAADEGIVGPYKIRAVVGDLRPNPLADDATDSDDEDHKM